MGKFVLLNVRLFTGGADLTSASNKVEVSTKVEEKETTNYGSQGYKELLGGLVSTEFAAEGQWEAGDSGKVDDASWAQLASVDAWTACPDTANAGSLAYLTRALRCDYKLGDAVGEVAPWTSSGKGSWPMARGQVAHPPGTARTTTGTGTALNLGAVPAGKRLYASLHVLSVAGTTPSITARVESDDTTGFASPTTRLTFNAATAAGGQMLRTDGTAITDTWWRIAWTISGTTPSFLFAAALGIQ